MWGALDKLARLDQRKGPAKRLVVAADVLLTAAPFVSTHYPELFKAIEEVRGVEAFLSGK